MDIHWHTEKRQLTDLKPFPGNPRTISEKQAADLRKSLNKFNLAEIPAVNLDGTILAGNMRFLMLKERGDAETDVRVPNQELTPDEAKEYCIRSNKNTGGWNYEILANEFEVENLIDWGFTEMDLTGEDFDIKDAEDGFDLPEGDRPGFQQMTFTLADEQADFIKEEMSKVEIESVLFDNENSNGNKLYSIVKQWARQKKS